MRDCATSPERGFATLVPVLMVVGLLGMSGMLLATQRSGAHRALERTSLLRRVLELADAAIEEAAGMTQDCLDRDVPLPGTTLNLRVLARQLMHTPRRPRPDVLVAVGRHGAAHCVKVSLPLLLARRATPASVAGRRRPLQGFLDLEVTVALGTPPFAVRRRVRQRRMFHIEIAAAGTGVLRFVIAGEPIGTQIE